MHWRQFPRQLGWVHDNPFPSVPFPPLLPLPSSPFPFNVGPEVSPPENIVILQMLVG